MRDKRSVDELSIDELERILAIRKRQQRQERLQRMENRGRVVAATSTPPPSLPSTPAVAQALPAPVAVAKPANGATEPPARPRPSMTPELRFDDDLEPETPPPAPQARSEVSRRVTNTLLLLVEVAAVIGLVVLGFNLFMAMNELETETAAAQALANETRLASRATPEPTAILQVRIEDYVLPGGHTIDTSGGVQFNLAEFIDAVPAHLQTAVVSQVFPVDFRRPEPTSDTALYLSIPRLGIDQGIVQGTDWEALKQGVGQVLNGINPGDSTGNVVLAAHNDIYGELFRHLDQLEPGDEFYIQTQTRTYTYRITGFDIVRPTDVYVMQNQGRATATLISCYPYRVNTQRYIVFAERVDGAGL